MKRPLVWIFASFLTGILMFQLLYPKPKAETVRNESKEAMVMGKVDRIEQKENTQALHLKNVIIHFDSKQTSYSEEIVSKIILYSSKEQSLRIGNQIQASGSISEFQSPTNPGQFNEKEYFSNNRYSYKMFAESIEVIDDSYSIIREVLRHVKDHIMQVYEGLLDEKDAGTASAMLLGDKSQLDSEMKELYSRTGIAHILAISGLHVSLIGMFFYQILIKMKRSLSFASGMTIVFLIAYGEMTGFSISTGRAVVMLLISLAANIIGRTYDRQTSLSFCGCILLIQNPFLLFQSGFLLSFGAVAGILYVLPILEGRFLTENKSSKKDRNILVYLYKDGMRFILSGLLVSWSVSIVSFPILCNVFYEIPLYSVLLNIIVIPCMSLIVLLCLIGGIAGGFSLIMGRFFIGAVPYILDLYEQLCRCSMRLPGHTITTGKPKLFQIGVYYILLLGICFSWFQIKEKRKTKLDLEKEKKYKRIELVCFILICILPGLLFIPKSDNILKVTMLDVGQGDGLLLEFPLGTTILVDGGSTDIKELGKYRLEPFLKCQGIQKLDYILLTHADADHISGVVEMMERKEINGIKIDNIILAKTNLIDEEYQKIYDLTAEQKITMIQMEEGMLIKEEEAYLQCLHPGRGFRAKSQNAYSIVCRLTYKDFDMLLTGDVELDGEELIMQNINHPENGYDVLKTAHHGSKNSTSKEFLTMCRPAIALISSGWKNRYGHPHPELLERLDACRSIVYTTIEEGAITIQTNGEKINVDSFVNGSKLQIDCK